MTETAKERFERHLDVAKELIGASEGADDLWISDIFLERAHTQINAAQDILRTVSAQALDEVIFNAE